MAKPLDKDPNFKMTQEEVKAFENAMKKPEFVDLLSEYMEEISDPKNREEYDQYLKQMERDQELPKGMKLLKPTPEFCIKTSLKGKNDSKFTTKLFINICSTTELQRPTFQTTSQSGQKGQNWKLPYITNKPRYDQDKEKKVCTTIDIAFNPYAIEILPRNPLFEKLLCDTAIDSTEKQLLDRNEVVSRDYKILKKMKCKGGEPATMTIRGSRLKEDPNKKQEDPPQKRQTDGDFGPKLYQEFKQKQRENDDKKKEEKDKDKEKEMEENENEDKGMVIEELEQTTSNQIDCPKYAIFYSYESEYFDFIEKREEKTRKMPKNMRIEVILSKLQPKIDSIGDMKLDINEYNLILDIPKKYYLDMKLSYPVLPDQGNAKYDAKTKKLKISLIIDQSKINEKNVEIQKTQESILEIPENKNEEISKSVENKNEEITEIKPQIPEDDLRKEENNENFIERNEDENKDNLLEFHEQNYFLKMKQETKNEENVKEENEKVLIEEIEMNENPQSQSGIDEEKETIENKVKILMKLEFKTQENGQKYFLIINLPHYSKENCQHRILSQEVLFLCEYEEKICYLWVRMVDEILVQNLEISFVTDYIVLIFSKSKENQFFEKNFGENLTNEYCDFQNKFHEIKPIIKEEIIKEEVTNKESIQQNEDNKEIECEKVTSEIELEKETGMDKKKEEEEKKMEIMEKRNQIQFINYDFPFIYDLD